MIGRHLSQTDQPTALSGSNGVLVHVVALAVLLVLFGPGLVHYLTISFLPDHANDDSRQVIWPVLRYASPSLFTDDPIAEYYIQNLLPSGYLALMRGAVAVVDPLPFSVALGHLSLVVSLVFAFLIGRHLSGPVGAWICVGILLAGSELLDETAGGLPRGTGFALTFMALYGFVCDRPRWTAAATILGALFWYPVAVSSGALFAVQRLSPPSLFGWRDTAPLVRRAATVVLVGLLTITLVGSKVVSGDDWGPVIKNTSLAWPEAGHGGRMGDRDQLGSAGGLGPVVHGLAKSFTNTQANWLEHTSPYRKMLLAAGLSLASLLGLLLVGWVSPLARRLVAVLAVSLLLYLAAVVLAPYLYAPSRFILLLAPWVGIFAFVYLAQWLGDWLARRQLVWRSQVVPVVLAALVIVLLGGRPSAQGYGVAVPAPERDAIGFISRLPQNSKIAGFPSANGITDNIPLFARRSVLLSYETHLPFHESYARAARAKAIAIIDAWHATDAGPIRSLRDDFGVTHFLIDKTVRAEASPWYFKPFDGYIAARHARSAGRARWIDAPPPGGIVFENDRFVIVDLSPPGPESRGG